MAEREVKVFVPAEEEEEEEEEENPGKPIKLRELSIY